MEDREYMVGESGAEFRRDFRIGQLERNDERQKNMKRNEMKKNVKRYD